MSEYHYLLGAEDVKNASHTFSNAVDNFRQSTNYLSEALHLHERFLTEWLDRFETAIQELNEKGHPR